MQKFVNWSYKRKETPSSSDKKHSQSWSESGNNSFSPKESAMQKKLSVFAWNKNVSHDSEQSKKNEIGLSVLKKKSNKESLTNDVDSSKPKKMPEKPNYPKFSDKKMPNLP